jgi:hypothetical protein
MYVCMPILTYLHVYTPTHMHRYAAMGCGNLATNVTVQEKVIQEGGLQPLLSLAKRDNGDIETQR